MKFSSGLRKSSAFGFLLASLHFGAFNVRVPSAVSVVWMAIVGSVLAVYWKGKPTEDSSGDSSGGPELQVLSDRLFS